MREVFGLGYSSRFSTFLAELVPQQVRKEQKIPGNTLYGAPEFETVYDPIQLSRAIENLAKERILEILQDEGPAKMKLSLSSGKLYIENAMKTVPHDKVPSLETIIERTDAFAQSEVARIEKRIIDKAREQEKERLGLGSGDRMEAWQSL